MEATREYGLDEEKRQREEDDRRIEWEATSEDELPFHIPRD